MMRYDLFFDRFRRIPPWVLLALLLAVHGAANYLYARLSSLEHVMNFSTIHEADYYMAFGYRFLTGPPFHLPEDFLEGWFRTPDLPDTQAAGADSAVPYGSRFFPSMGAGLEGERPFSWSRVNRIIEHWVAFKGFSECNPFFLVPAALGCAFWGPSTTVLVLTPTLYLLILLLFTYLCGKEIDGPSAGLWAALFLGMIPWVIGLSRYGRSYICLIAVCSVTYYLLLRTRRFSRPICSMLFVASFLFCFYAVPTQTEFFLFVLAMTGPALVHAVTGLLRGEGRLRTVFILAAVGALFVLMEREWGVIDYVLAPRYWDAQEQLTRGDIFRNPSAILAYPFHLVMVQLSPIIALCAAYPIWRCFRGAPSQTSSAHRIDLAVMFILPLAVLFCLHKKQPIYITHLCLPLALAAGCGLAGIQRKKCFSLLLVLLGLTGLAWRSIPIDKLTGSSLPIPVPAARAVDKILWKDSCRGESLFEKAFFSGNRICYATQLWIPYPETIVQPIDPALWKKEPSGFFAKMSRIDGVRIGMASGMVSGIFGTTIRKGAALMALNPTITVHLFNGMKSFDLSVEDLDWIVVGPLEEKEVAKWLESENAGEARSSPWDKLVPTMYFFDSEPDVKNFRRFMIELKERAELRFRIQKHFFFSTPRGWEKAGGLARL